MEIQTAALPHFGAVWDLVERFGVEWDPTRESGKDYDTRTEDQEERFTAWCAAAREHLSSSEALWLRKNNCARPGAFAHALHTAFRETPYMERVLQEAAAARAAEKARATVEAPDAPPGLVARVKAAMKAAVG